MRHGLFLVSILGLAISCINEKDYNLTSVTVHPSLAFPVAFGNLTVQDLLKTKDSIYVKVYPDDLVYLEYSDVLISRNIRDLFTIRGKSINQSFGIPSGTLPPHPNDIRSDSLIKVVDLGLNPEQLSQIDFKSGTITYSATLLPASNLPFDVILSSGDLTSKSTGSPLSITTHSSGSLPLADYKVVLNKNKFTLKLVLVLKKTTSSHSVGPNTSVAVSFSMMRMDFNVILGFFGDQTVRPPSETFKIGAFGTTLNSSNISFAQPKVTLDVINGYGVPCKVDFSRIEARKDGATLSFQLNPPSPISIAYPATLGSSATTSVSITNAKQLMDFGPTKLFYQLSARINPGLTSGNNFLADTSTIKVKMNVEVPLYGHASGIVLKDTAKIELSKLDQSQIQSASLKVDVKNELPLDAKIQLYLTDANYIVTDSLLATAQTSLIKGSSVTASGDLKTARVVSDVIVLNVDKLNKIFTSKNIIIKAVLNSSKDASGNSQDVKFKSKYSIKVNIGMLAELNFNIKQ
jgi:hypothetical protein